MHRRGLLVFGIAAIAAGVAIGKAAAMGWEAPPSVLILITLVVIGWAICYWIWILIAVVLIRFARHRDETRIEPEA